MKAVMYHYVRRFNPAFPYFRFLDFDSFRRQLDYFQKDFGFADPADLEHAVAGRSELPRDKVVLTFDDGLKDHYDYVFPELKRRGLSGIFYVATRPYTERRFLGVHLIHLLVGAVPADDLVVQLDRLVDDSMIPDIRVREFREENYRWQNNPPTIDRFKRTLNYYIDYQHRDRVLDQLVADNGIEVTLEDHYLTVTQIREMAAGGMMFGSHSVSHPIFSKLDYEEQKKEIFGSFKALEELLDGGPPATFCFPYGGRQTFNDDTISLLEEAGCRFSFSVDPQDIATVDLVERPLFLPRYDCNLFPHGKAS